MTDFPDWRLKCVIRDSAGFAMILIPREGGVLGRLYVELGTAAQAAGTGLDDVVAAALRHDASSRLFSHGHEEVTAADPEAPEASDDEATDGVNGADGVRVRQTASR